MHGVDPERNGWTAPKRRRMVPACQATPELLQGISLEHQGLARILQRAGYPPQETVKPLMVP